MDAPANRIESINWLELFFDLVVVAAIAVLTEGLREDLSWHGIGMLVLLYTTIWVAWSLTVFYANVAKEQTRVRTVTIAMFLIAVMAASAPIHEESHANIFAIAFLILRSVMSRSSLITGRILQSWPLLQFGGMSLLWVISLWLDTPAKYWLWAVALGIDLAMVIVRNGDSGDGMLERWQSRFDKESRRGPQARKGPAPTAVAVDVDRRHLDERLGLFVIIVLGEAIAQLVHAAATHEWTTHFEWIAIAGFLLLTGLWRHTFAHGFTGVPHTSLADLPPRFGLPLHLLSTMGLVFVAAALAEMLAHTEDHVESPVSWLLAGGMALFFGVSLVAGIAGSAPKLWLYGWGATSTVYSIALGPIGPHLAPVAFAWAAALPALWQVFAGKSTRI